MAVQRYPFRRFWLCKALRRWRTERKMKISTAARELGVSVSTWGHWETGAHFPTPARLVDLEQYTGLCLIELVCPFANSEGCQRRRAANPCAAPS
ncbi:MAG: helix-turn-helix transcriptional regulator [Chthoniobacterales bacterium]|nr:helix-turn-helix transcriptional regulator [Chthoniobacterales bacterium]